MLVPALLVLAVLIPTLATNDARTLLFVPAPYGRHYRPGWGPTLPSRAGWILMEGFAFAAFAGVYLLGGHRAAAAPLVLFAMWQIHYFHRAFLFPFRMREQGKRMQTTQTRRDRSWLRF